MSRRKEYSILYSDQHQHMKWNFDWRLKKINSKAEAHVYNPLISIVQETPQTSGL
jgi:hypothetical protein